MSGFRLEIHKKRPPKRNDQILGGCQSNNQVLAGCQSNNRILAGCQSNNQVLAGCQPKNRIPGRLPIQLLNWVWQTPGIFNARLFHVNFRATVAHEPDPKLTRKPVTPSQTAKNATKSQSSRHQKTCELQPWPHSLFLFFHLSSFCSHLDSLFK